MGFDIAGPEKGFPAEMFREAYELQQRAKEKLVLTCGHRYDIARAGGLGLTAHAGEADGWESVESAVRTVLLPGFSFFTLLQVKNLGVSRIGHGVALRDSEATRLLVKERNICVESCITSNILTKVFAFCCVCAILMLAIRRWRAEKRIRERALRVPD